MPTMPPHKALLVATLLLPAGAMAQPASSGTTPLAGAKSQTQETFANPANGTGSDKQQMNLPLTASAIVSPPAPSRDGRLAFWIENNSTQALALQRVQVLDVVRVEGSDRNALAGDRPAVPAKTSPCGGEGFPKSIPAGASCRFEVDLSDLSGPGRYEARIRVAGAAGEPQTVTLVSERRLSESIALLLIFLGAGTGWFVGWWRGGAETRMGDLIAARVAADDIQSVAHRGGVAAPGTADAIAGLLAAASGLIDRIASGDYSSAEVTELRRRAGLVRDFTGLNGKPEVTQAALRKLAPPLGGELNAPLDSGEVEKLKKAIRDSNGSAPETALQTLPVDPRAPLPVLRSRTMWLSNAVGIILLAVFAAVAFQTIYSSGTWGSYPDLLAAFLIGFLAYAGTATGVSTLVAGARTKPA